MLRRDLRPTKHPPLIFVHLCAAAFVAACADGDEVAQPQLEETPAHAASAASAGAAAATGLDASAPGSPTATASPAQPGSPSATTASALPAAGSGAAATSTTTDPTSDATAESSTSAGAAGAAETSAGAMAGAPSTAGPTQTSASCADACPQADGVPWGCNQRFMYGVNYAWHNFAADFGGNQAWSQPGVSQEPAVEAELQTMAANGVNVVRWWLWPDFRGDGVTFDASDTPTGLGGTALADVARALELAEQHDLYLMLTLFSFDNFRPTRMESSLRVRGIKPIVLDDNKRSALMQSVVARLAQAVAASPYSERMLAWDIINEPEWAVTGASMYGGDPEFDPMPELEPVTHAQMELFVKDVLSTLRSHSAALATVGGTAIKWAHAWSGVDLDFHQFHMYDWVNMYWPYDKSPMMYGLDDKPLVMGEFPLNGLSGVPYGQLLASWFGNRYAGALGWAFTDSEFNQGDYSAVKAFADAHTCETRY